MLLFRTSEKRKEKIVSEALRFSGVEQNTITELLHLLQKDFGGIGNQKEIVKRLRTYAPAIIDTPSCSLYEAYNEYLALSFDTNTRAPKKVRTFFKSKLDGSIIVDLCSDGSWEYYKKALWLDPKKMIYVDKHNIRSDSVWNEQQAFISCDALTFLSILPDHSIDCSMSGVDHWTITTWTPAASPYLSGLHQELARTLKIWGIFFWRHNSYAPLLGKWMHNTLKDMLPETPIISNPLAEIFLYEKK